MGLISLDEVVRNCISDFDYTDLTKYNKIKSKVVRGFEQLEIWVVPYISTAVLCIRDNMTVKLPDDFMYYTKVGITYNNKLYVLGLNEDISLESCGCSSAEEAEKVICSGAELEDRYVFHNIYEEGIYRSDEKYGLAAGRNAFGYYRFDKRNNLLHITTNNICNEFSKIYLEYKGNSAITGLSHVPSECRETLIQWAGSKMFHGTARGDRYERGYQMNYNKLKSLYETDIKTEYEDQFLSSIKSTPKR